IRNVLAYLRESSSKGDPGTLLYADKKNEIGRGAETWRDYSPATERALQGKFIVAIAKLVEVGVLAFKSEDRQERLQLRLEFRRLVFLGQLEGARRVLFRLLEGRDPRDDASLAAAVGDAVPIATARSLLA